MSPPYDLKPGNVVRLTCENDEAQRWTQDGTVMQVEWSGMLILDGPDGQIGWDVIESLEVLSVLPEEELA